MKPPAWVRTLAPAALVALALLLRLWPVGHGLPADYVPDTHVVRAALGMARDKDPVPPVGRYSTYPYLIPYMLLPLYAGQYAAGRATGRWSSSAEFAEAVIEEPAGVHLTARLLVAVLGAATVWAAFRGARAAGLERGGAAVAAWLVATGLLHVQFSVQERPWVPTLFFGALALWGAARYEREGRPRALVLAGAAAGLAFACHQAGLFFLLACGLAWLLGPGGWSAAALSRRIGLGAACVAVCLAVGVLCGHLYYLRGAVPDSEVAGHGSADAEYVSIGGQALRFGFELDSLERLSTALAGYDPVLLLLGLAGIALALRRPGTRSIAAFTALYALFFLFNPSDHVRYLLPLTVLLAWPAGLLGERLLARRGGAVVLALLLAFPLVQALRLGVLLRREDTRAAAAERIEVLARVHPDMRLAVDHYGPALPFSEAALERIEEVRELRTREAHRLAKLRTNEVDGGLDVLPAEELFWIDPESREYTVRPAWSERAARPAELLDELGATHFLLVNRRPANRDVPFLAALARDWELLERFDPSRGSRPAGEAFLPTEMDYPLTALWQVARPGPLLELYALNP